MKNAALRGKTNQGEQGGKTRIKLKKTGVEFLRLGRQEICVILWALQIIGPTYSCNFAQISAPQKSFFRVIFRTRFRARLVQPACFPLCLLRTCETPRTGGSDTSRNANSSLIAAIKCRPATITPVIKVKER